MTVRDFITDLLVVLGVLSQGETPNNSEAFAVFNELNTLIDQWNADGLTFFSLTDSTYPLTIGLGTYTLGTAGSLGVNRPARIRNAAAIAGGFSFPVRLITNDEYNLIREKGEQAKAPRELYCDYGFPTATLKPWPVPSAACDLQLFTWTPLAGYDEITQDMILPPPYKSAIKYNLGLRVGPGFGARVDALFATQAVESKQAMQRYNAESLGMVPAPQPTAPAQSQ